ncbi:MAG: CsgG/HfaB family protein [Prevotellaceae bacterium]|nr:CsgG/HfaB family protein [Prevotellaceae bacterium]
MEFGDHSKNEASLKSLTSRGKYNLIVLLCCFLFSTVSAFSQNEKMRVALIELRDISHNGYSADVVRLLTSTLTTELVNTNKYRVVERSRINQIIKEQGFQSSQEVSSQAVKIGKLLGINKIITGEGDKSSANIRFIDVETGDIEAAVTVRRGLYKKNGKLIREMSVEEWAKKILEELFKALE